jgi:hypothetical protein
MTSTESHPRFCSTGRRPVLIARGAAALAVLVPAVALGKASEMSTGLSGASRAFASEMGAGLRVRVAD